MHTNTEGCITVLRVATAVYGVSGPAKHGADAILIACVRTSHCSILNFIPFQSVRQGPSNLHTFTEATQVC